LENFTAQLQSSQTALKAATLDLQDKCARQAHETFKNLGWDKEPLAGYGNHYHVGLNKCFILIYNTSSDSSDSGRLTTVKLLLDAFEGATYGDYEWDSEKDKKYWEVKPYICDITLPSGESTHCQSQDEFDEVVKTYMGENFH
jgi:hypothetical protein